MSALFRNSFYTLLGVLLISIIGLRFYLQKSPIVPAWMPPPICPCWDSASYQCQPQAYCSGTLTTEPTPTPYQQLIVTRPQEIKIQSISFTENCQVNIELNTKDVQNFNLPNDRTINTTACPTDIKYYLSPDGKFAVFDNFSNPKSPGATLYAQHFNKVVTLENWQQPTDRIIDALFLSDNHLLILIYGKIKSYDLNTLFNNYPGNVDFYQNKFKSISLESNTINLANYRDPATSMTLSGNALQIKRIDDQVLEEFDLVRLYPRSSCPCWDVQKNYCLPQSACLAPESP